MSEPLEATPDTNQYDATIAASEEGGKTARSFMLGMTIFFIVVSIVGLYYWNQNQDRLIQHRIIGLCENRGGVLTHVRTTEDESFNCQVPPKSKSSSGWYDIIDGWCSDGRRKWPARMADSFQCYSEDANKFYKNLIVQ